MHRARRPRRGRAARRRRRGRARNGRTESSAAATRVGQVVGVQVVHDAAGCRPARRRRARRTQLGRLGLDELDDPGQARRRRARSPGAAAPPPGRTRGDRAAARSSSSSPRSGRRCARRGRSARRCARRLGHRSRPQASSSWLSIVGRVHLLQHLALAEVHVHAARQARVEAAHGPHDVDALEVVERRSPRRSGVFMHRVLVRARACRRCRAGWRSTASAGTGGSWRSCRP